MGMDPVLPLCCWDIFGIGVINFLLLASTCELIN